MEEGHKPDLFSHGVIESDGETINRDAGIELSAAPFDTLTIRFPETSGEAMQQILACLEEHYPADGELIEELNEFGATPYSIQGNTLRIISEDENLQDELSAIQEDFCIPLHQDWTVRTAGDNQAAEIAR
ncbi:MAG: hypothetical protein ACOYJ2_08840 [Rickettsiales bacterium]